MLLFKHAEESWQASPAVIEKAVRETWNQYWPTEWRAGANKPITITNRII